MIGMNQIKKKFFSGLIIGIIIGLALTALAVVWGINIINSYKDLTNENVGKKVYVFNKTVTKGEYISSSMISEKQMHKNDVPINTVTDIEEIVNKIATYSILSNTAITNDMVSRNPISSDVRIKEINFVKLPSDLVEGDLIDIRLMLPNGTDFVVLAGKIVDKINSESIWLKLTEKEILYLNSALVETYSSDKSKIYALKYVDSKTQIGNTKVNYVPNQSVLNLINNNPNIVRDAQISLNTKIKKEIQDLVDISIEKNLNKANSLNYKATETINQSVKLIDEILNR